MEYFSVLDITFTITRLHCIYTKSLPYINYIFNEKDKFNNTTVVALK